MKRRSGQRDRAPVRTQACERPSARTANAVGVWSLAVSI